MSNATPTNSRTADLPALGAALTGERAGGGTQARDSHTKLRVLFVEDSAFDCGLLVRLLQQSGFSLEWDRVEDEPAMRTALQNKTWDAIISDHNLPRFSSTGALELHKEFKLGVPFLIVSGEIGESVAIEAMLAGADDYILKSRLARLPAALTRSLRDAESRLQRQNAEAALRESEERLRSITSNLPGMVFQILYQRASGRWEFQYVSQGAYRTLGIAAMELLVDPMRFTGRVASADLTVLETQLRLRAALMGELRWQGRIGVPETESGVTTMRERWIELNGSPRALGTEAVIWEGVIVDISAQKSAEEALMQSREEIRSLATHLENVKEEERKAIARDVHDDIGGLIASLKFDISWLQSRPDEDATRRQRVDDMAAVLDSARRAAYRIMRDLRPSVLDLGIVAAIDWLAKEFEKRHLIVCTFSSNRESIDMPDAYRTAMFRICQESLTNIVKHANATKVDIELFDDGEALTLEILDNGAGMAEEAMEKNKRFGIRGMRERASQMGGWIEVGGSEGNGTSIMLFLPKDKLEAK